VKENSLHMGINAGNVPSHTWSMSVGFDSKDSPRDFLKNSTKYYGRSSKLMKLIDKSDLVSSVNWWHVSHE
jgi:hypothetical protein